MAGLLNLEKYMPPSPSTLTEEEAPPWKELTEEQVKIRDWWNGMSAEEQTEWRKTASPSHKKVAYWGLQPGLREEMPEDLQDLRTKLKDYEIVTTPEERLQHAAEANPQYKYEMHGGRIFAQPKQGIPDWYSLDPSTDFFSLGTLKDLPMDFRDIATEVGQATAETAGAISLGTAGFVSPVPGGALVGAATGAGLAGGATNVLMQQAAIADGVRKRPVDWEEGGTDAMLAAAGTVLTGTGAPKQLLRNAAKKRAAKQATKLSTQRATAQADSQLMPGTAPQVRERLIREKANELYKPIRDRKVQELTKSMEKANRGLIERGVEYLPKKLAPIVTGTDKDLMKTASTYLDDFREISKAANKSDDRGAEAVQSYFGDPVKKNVVDTLSKERNRLGSTLEAIADNTVAVDLTPFHKGVADFTDDMARSLRTEWTPDNTKDAYRKVAQSLKGMLFTTDDLGLEKVAGKNKYQTALDTHNARVEAFKNGKATGIVAPTNEIKHYNRLYTQQARRTNSMQKALETLDGRLREFKRNLKDDKDIPKLRRMQANMSEATKKYQDELALRDLFKAKLLEKSDNFSKRLADKADKHTKYFEGTQKPFIADDMSPEMKKVANFLDSMGLLENGKYYSAVPTEMSGTQSRILADNFKKLAKANRADTGQVLSDADILARDRLQQFGDFSKHIAKSINDASGEISDLYGGTYKNYMDMYADHKRVEEILKPFDSKIGGNRQKALDVVRNLYDSENKMELLSTIARVAPEALPAAQKYQSFRVWGKALGDRPNVVKEAIPPLERRMMRGAGGSMLGLGLGALGYATGQPVLQGLGYGLGLGLGAATTVATSPSLLRSATNARDLAKHIDPLGHIQARATWDLMKREEENRKYGNK